jgi:hypothetical protein
LKSTLAAGGNRRDLGAAGRDVIDPLPIYSPGFENYDDPLTKNIRCS